MSQSLKVQHANIDEPTYGYIGLASCLNSRRQMNTADHYCLQHIVYLTHQKASEKSSPAYDDRMSWNVGSEI